MAMMEDHEPSSRVGIAMLVVLRLLPSVWVAPLGGVLADRYDRKWNMVALDVVGTVVALCHVVAFRLGSIRLLYACTAAQQMVTGLYDPSKSAIVPMLVSREYLPKATTLNGIIWSTMAAVGAATGGLIVYRFGIAACFWLDSSSYLASALLLAVGVTGKSFVSSFHEHETESSDVDEQEAVEVGETPAVVPTEPAIANVAKGARNSSFRNMIRDALMFLWQSPYGPMVFIKGSGALLFGCSDVITVVFAEDAETGELDSERLGWMFAAVGLGCIIGPTITDRVISDESHDQIGAWQWLSSSAFALIGLGYVMIGVHANYWARSRGTC